MNTCLIHQQMYPLGRYCPYCGHPQGGSTAVNVETFETSVQIGNLCLHRELTTDSFGTTRCNLCGTVLTLVAVGPPYIKFNIDAIEFNIIDAQA